VEGIWITPLEPPSAGPRLAVKDLFDTAGVRTTYGSAIFSNHVPDRSAAAVSQLEAAGYAIAGKANLHELAYGVTSENAHYGTVPNPLAAGRTAGGSSGGNAAALAAGLADAALGSDSGGSIRIPSACCGTVGFKPSFGLVSLDGCWPLAPTFDHAGPMARDVAGCVAMMHALTGIDAKPAELAELRVALAWTEEADPLVRARVESAAMLFGSVTRVDLPFARGTTDLFMREIAEVHRELYAENADLYGADVARKIERCLEVTDGEAARAETTRADYRARVAELLEGYDLLVSPTTPCVAPPSAAAEDDERRFTLIRFTYPFNVLGRPALALPCGPAEHGLPASIQLVGAVGADAAVLGAGLALERALKR
jgi:aspartyl-tRNA(Asn)/glutamyl-tRNA(Gln) amidotransferase subunit A